MLPRIEDMVNNLSKYKVFSTYDLKSAYQIPIKESDRKYTAFEANGQLLQFCVVPFGVTNGVPVFQRSVDKIVAEEKLDDTFPYMDNVTVAGIDQEYHDGNDKAFLETDKHRNLTLNETKSVRSVPVIDILGYRVSYGNVSPDPERLRALNEFPLPTNAAALRRVQGMLSYYAKWISQFSDKIKPLIEVTTFPLDHRALAAFNLLKKEFAEVTLSSIDEDVPFVTECDAANVAVSATLNQNSRPVAFMSKTLSKNE